MNFTHLYNFKKNWFWFVPVFIYCFKILFLDLDLPKYSVSSIAVFDEYYYSFLAFNYYDFSDIFFGQKHFFLTHPKLINLLTYIGLCVFGNNYTGLRFTSFVEGLIVLFLVIKILGYITDNIRVKFFLLLFIVLNFSFFIQTIAVEPTIDRLLFMLIALFLCLKWSKEIREKRGYILVLFFGVIAQLYISYLTNAFVIGATYCCVILSMYYHNPNKSTWVAMRSDVLKLTRLFLIALVGSIIFYLFLSWSVKEDLAGMLKIITKYEDRIATSANFFYNVARNIFKITDSSLFRQNYLFLIVFFITLVYFLFSTIRKKDFNRLCIFFFLFFFLFQTALLNDFPGKKLLPLLIFWVFMVAFILDDFFNGWKWQIQLVVSFVGLALLLIEGSKIGSFIWNRSYYNKTQMSYLSKYKNQVFIGGYSMGCRGYNTIKPVINIYQYKKINDLDYQNDVRNVLKTQDIAYSIMYGKDENLMNSLGFKKSTLINDGRFGIRPDSMYIYIYKKP